MSIPVPLRSDFDAALVRRLAKSTKHAAQGRRLLALAEIYDGGTRTDAARIGGVGLQTLRDWILAFNAEGPDGLIDGKAAGHPCKLNDAQRQALVRVVESGPIPAANRTSSAIASCRPARSIMARTKPRWRNLRKPPRPVGGGRSDAPKRHRHRVVVPGRSTRA